MKLAGWQAAARSVVFIDPQGSSHCFRLRQRFDGTSRLEPRAARSASGPHLCVLARSLVYRRRLQSRPRARRGIENLLRAARDYFPAGLQPANYCAFEDADGLYLCALPQERLKEIQADVGEVQALLVGPDEPDGRRLLEVIERRHRLGAAADLATAPARLIPAARIAVAGALLAFATVAAASAWLVAATYPGSERLSRRVAEAETRAGEPEQQYRSILRMLAAQRALGQFAQSPGARALEVVAAVLRSTPAGHAVTSIELKNGELKITGVGARPAEWLGAHGVPADAIATYRLQQTDRFTVKFPLPREAGRPT